MKNTLTYFGVIWLTLFCVVGTAEPTFVNDTLQDDPQEEILDAHASGPLAVTVGLKYKQTYEFSAEPPEKYEDLYKGLDSDARQTFQSRRRWVLRKFAGVLNFARLGIGLGAWVKDHFLQILPSKHAILHPIRHLLLGEKAPPSPVPAAAGPGSLGERGHVLVQKILNAIDRKLWSHAPVVARGNEVGGVIFIGGGGGVMQGSRGKYFSTGVAFSFGVSFKNKSLVFEFVHGWEWGRGAYPAMAEAGVGMNVMTYFADRDLNAPIGVARLHGMYGLGKVFMGESPGGVSVGKLFSLNIPGVKLLNMIGLNQISSLMAYDTDIGKYPVVELSLSPKLPWFVRLRSGLPDALKLARASVEDVVREIAHFGDSQSSTGCPYTTLSTAA